MNYIVITFLFRIQKLFLKILQEKKSNKSCVTNVPTKININSWKNGCAKRLNTIRQFLFEVSTQRIEKDRDWNPKQISLRQS